jgi:DNA double-strand break repair helicase HerA and related ATPase
MVEPIVIAGGKNPLSLLPGMANRQGLIADTTGTGKTTSGRRR